MSNHSPGLGSNDAIKKAIQRIALHGVANRDTGIVRNTEKITGYVVKIHTEGDLAGTIDVQEYVNLGVVLNESVKPGYHEGVYLSAIQDNRSGMVIIPKLYSEVTVETDPATLTEYVTMFSHVECIQLDAHDIVTIGVSEREEYDVDDVDGKEVDELDLTGAHAKTIYTKDSATTEVQVEENGDKTTQMITGQDFSVDVSEESSLLINKETIVLQRGNSSNELSDSENKMACGSSSVIVQDSTVFVGGDNNTDDAVLGVELASLLEDVLDSIAQIQVTTQLGPQPVLNMAKFIATKAKISAYKSSHSGFLTKKVQIQK